MKLGLFDKSLNKIQISRYAFLKFGIEKKVSWWLQKKHKQTKN